MGALLITGPTSEPVRLDEVKIQLRADDDAIGTALSSLIRPARQYVENELRRALITQTWEYTVDRGWPMAECRYRIDLPMQPVQSVTSVTYVDQNGATQTLATSQYALRDTGAEGLAYIEPAYDVTWPAVRDQAAAIRVRYIAGYGTASAVPESIKQAIMLHIELLYDRNPQMKGLLESARDSLLSHYRVVRV